MSQPLLYCRTLGPIHGNMTWYKLGLCEVSDVVKEYLEAYTILFLKKEDILSFV